MSRETYFGRYRGERIVGAGAFASVWLAHDDDLMDAVAVKVLAENWAQDTAVRQRFLREARFLRRLDHDRVVRVHTIDELPDGRPYFVMTYADRGTLRDRIAGRSAANQDFSIGEALELAGELAECLLVVHELGIVHRDVKPSNVLFRSIRRHQRDSETRDERLLLADFGVARDAVQTSEATLGAGTPAYMAPEQIVAGHDIDERADLFSVVAVFYELLTGRAPYTISRFADPLGTMPLAVARVRPGIDPRVAALVERGLAADPDTRFQSAQDLLAALRTAADREASRRDTSVVERSLDPATRPREDAVSRATRTLLDTSLADGAMDLSAARARLDSPLRVVLVAADEASAAASTRRLAAHDVPVDEMALAVAPDLVSVLAAADLVILDAERCDLSIVEAAVARAQPGPVAVAALGQSLPPRVAARFTAVATAESPGPLVDLWHALSEHHQTVIRASAALLLADLAAAPGAIEAQHRRRFHESVERLRMDFPELGEVDVLRADAQRGLRLPDGMRAEIRRLLLGASPVSRLGLPNDVGLAAARAAADEALRRWRSYSGSDRAAFSSRPAVETLTHLLERMWIELTNTSPGSN